MTTVVIVIHLMVVVAMIGLILLQRSEGGALGIGGGQGAFMTGRSAGNILSHTTAYLALAFFLTSLGLAFIAKYESRPSDILERLPGQTTPATETPAAPAPTGAPTTAEDLLKQLGGQSGGPQTPPATDGAAAPPAADGAPAPAPAPATQAPAETPPAAGGAVPPAPEPAPAPQAPPAQ